MSASAFFRPAGPAAVQTLQEPRNTWRLPGRDLRRRRWLARTNEAMTELTTAAPRTSESASRLGVSMCDSGWQCLNCIISVLSLLTNAAQLSRMTEVDEKL